MEMQGCQDLVQLYGSKYIVLEKKNTNRQKAWLFQHKPNLVATYSTNIQITMGSSI